MARFGVVLDEWGKENRLAATAVQCWTSMEEFFGVVPCTVMSMLSDSLLPSACETDINGLVGMLALQLASGTPSPLADWNNNYGDDSDKGVIFHCSNLPKHFFTDTPNMDYQEIIAGTVGKENTYGTVVGRLKTGPFTYCRVSTDDVWGDITVYVGEGELTDDPLETFGGYGVVHVPNLQGLLQHSCENGFEHHVAVNLSQVASAVAEALDKYWSGVSTTTMGRRSDAAGGKGTSMSKHKDTIGSATFAAVAVGKEAGGYDSIFEAANRMARLQDVVYKPDPARKATYDQLFAVHLTLHDTFGRGGERRDEAAEGAEAAGVETESNSVDREPDRRRRLYRDAAAPSVSYSPGLETFHSKKEATRR